MNLYIKKAFINARNLFATPIRFKPPNYRTIQDFFFDRQLLTDGAPPNDRGCRACGKIGHLVADCPRKKAADNRKKEDRERREKEKQEKQEKQEKRDSRDNREQKQGEKREVQQVKETEKTPTVQEKPRDAEPTAPGNYSFSSSVLYNCVRVSVWCIECVLFQ